MITLEQVKRELDTTNEDYDELLQWLIDSVQSVWEQMTNKTWIEQDCTETFYSVDSRMIFLKTEFLSYIYSISSGLDSALMIYNTESSTVSTVTVTDDRLILISDSTTEEITFAANATLTNVASAIGLVSGWSASVYSGFESKKSTILLETSGCYCDDTGSDLYVPDEYVTGATVDKRLRSIKLPYIASPIIVKYKGGYTKKTAPEWLRQILIRQVNHWYLQGIEKRWHVSSMALGDGGTVSYKNQKANMLPDFIELAEKHQRYSI